MADQDKFSGEALRQAVAESMRSAQEVGTRIRDLTLQALEQHRFDYVGFRQVLQSVTEGVTQGAAQQGAQAKAAMASALAGMDQAMTATAQASRQAMDHLAQQGQDFTDAHVSQGLTNLKQMEQDFLQCVSRAASETEGSLGEHWRGLLRETQVSGTGVGKVVSDASTQYAHRVTTAMTEVSAAGLDAARKMSDYLGEAASGFLARVSEALRTPPGQTPPGQMPPDTRK